MFDALSHLSAPGEGDVDHMQQPSSPAKDSTDIASKQDAADAEDVELVQMGNSDALHIQLTAFGTSNASVVSPPQRLDGPDTRYRHEDSQPVGAGIGIPIEPIISAVHDHQHFHFFAPSHVTFTTGFSQWLSTGS